MKVLSLFSIPLLVDDIKIDDNIKSLIMNENYKLMLNDNSYISENTYLLNESKYLNIKNAINEKVLDYLRNCICVKSHIEFYMTNSWAVKNDPSNWCISHSHANSLLSGVLYLQTDENTGDIVFERENNSIFPNVIDIEYENWNLINSKSWTIKPKDDMFLLFPSHLKHLVRVNKSKMTRYSIAFNFFTKGHFGKNSVGELIIN